MRILNLNKVKWNRKVLFAYFAVILVAIISGIVLYITDNMVKNLYNFAKEYLLCVFNFKNLQLFFANFFSALFYYYLAFAICYFTKLKFLTAILLFVKSFFTFYYFVLLVAIFSVEGFFAAILVFLPCYAFWVFKFLFFCTQTCAIEKPYLYFAPLVFAILDGFFLLLILNLVFRFVVVIV